MSGIGSRLRQERERLGLSQKAFGMIGGVEANAQGKYENGDRAPKADYLSRVAERGVDVLYVLTGSPTPTLMDNLSAALRAARTISSRLDRPSSRVKAKLLPLIGARVLLRQPPTRRSTICCASIRLKCST